MPPPDSRDIIVAVCTYNRNADLTNLIEKLIECARHWSNCRIGMTIVDDSADGGARSVAERFADSFALGLVYENSASRNISVARNHALSNSIDRAHWIAMTDDDCEPSEQWLSELVRVQMETGADVATGLMLRRAPDHAPNWIKRQPFLQLGEFSARDGDEMPVANTNNSLISSAFLQKKPNLRFDPQLGRLGGEDMAFFHSLKDAGAKIVFAANAFVYENEPDERLTIRYQLRRYFWQGNSSALTTMTRGYGRTRLAVHGGANIARAASRPLTRLVKGSSPQLLFALAQVAEGLGCVAGAIGVKVSHK